MEMFQEHNSAECASTVSFTSKDEDAQEPKHDITQQQDEITTREMFSLRLFGILNLHHYCYVLYTIDVICRQAD